MHDTKNKNSWVVLYCSGLILKNRDDAHREELLITTVTSFLLLSLMAFVSFMNARRRQPDILWPHTQEPYDLEIKAAHSHKLKKGASYHVSIWQGSIYNQPKQEGTPDALKSLFKSCVSF